MLPSRSPMLQCSVVCSTIEEPWGHDILNYSVSFVSCRKWKGFWGLPHPEASRFEWSTSRALLNVSTATNNVQLSPPDFVGCPACNSLLHHREVVSGISVKNNLPDGTVDHSSLHGMGPRHSVAKDRLGQRMFFGVAQRGGACHLSLHVKLWMAWQDLVVQLCAPKAETV